MGKENGSDRKMEANAAMILSAAAIKTLLLIGGASILLAYGMPWHRDWPIKSLLASTVSISGLAMFIGGGYLALAGGGLLAASMVFAALIAKTCPRCRRRRAMKETGETDGSELFRSYERLRCTFCGHEVWRRIVPDAGG